MQASKILRVAFCCPNLSIRSAKSGFMRSCQFLLRGTYFYDRARLRQRRSKRAVCGFACYGECFNRARLRQRRGKRAACGFYTLRRMLLLPHVCGKGGVNVPLAVLRVTANAFITACVCGREAANVPFAVLRVTANALTARVCGKGEANVPFAVLRVTANALTARVCGKGEVNVLLATLYSFIRLR